jgi:hypothetical protein
MIECPISGLWKLITKTRPLTLLTFCCSLAAIPSTVRYKTLFREALPKPRGRLTNDTFEQRVEMGNVPSAPVLPADLCTFSKTGMVGMALLSRQAILIFLLGDDVLEGV